MINARPTRHVRDYAISMLGVLAIIYVVIMVPVEYFRNPPKNVPIKTR